MELVEDNNLYKIYASNYFNDILPELSNYLDDGIINVMQFFNLSYIDKIKIYLYDSSEEYQRLFKVPYPPNGIAGCFGYENVRIYADLDKITKQRFFSCILHEITHVIYRNYIQESGINNRVIWFDEGLAMFLSGEKNNLYDNANLNAFINEKIVSDNKEIPDILFLYKHGTNYGEFVDVKTNKYNGYDWAYLMIRYLVETLSKEDFNKLMRKKSNIQDIENNIIDNTYNYFVKKVKIK